MELIVLGSGTCLPEKNKNPSGYAVKEGKEAIVLDFGSGNLKQLLQAGLDFKKVKHYFFSHVHHPDHISELPTLLLAWKVSYDLGLIKRKETLYFFGPKGTKKHFQLLQKIYPFLKKKLPFKIKVKELRKSQVKLKKFKITTLPLEHGNCLGFRIENKKKALVYSGDTRYCENLLDLSKKADLLLLESSHTRKTPYHLTPEECGEITEKSQAQKLVLTHVYPLTQNRRVKVRAGKIFKGKIILAKDLMKIKV